MSLMYRGGLAALPIVIGTCALSAVAHVGLPIMFLRSEPVQTQDATPEETGIQGAIMFDLSDIIAAPSDGAMDAIAQQAAEDTATVTESPEVVEVAQAADEPILNQTPYDVDDDSLKFGVAAPEPAQETADRATDVAQEFDEEKVDQETQVGSTAAEESQASVSGVDADAQADTAQASSEGLTAEQLAEISQWQQDIVLTIAKAKSYPDSARNNSTEGEVVVTFTVDRYGAIVARDVSETSGSDVLDRAAIAIFDGLEKLPTPPNHLVGDEFTLSIPINYTIKRSG